MNKRKGTGKQTPTRPWKAASKLVRRQAAEERNNAYQALSLDEKLARNSTKVQAKLLNTKV